MVFFQACTARRIWLRAPVDASPQIPQPMYRAFLRARRGGARPAHRYRRRLATGSGRTHAMAHGAPGCLHRCPVLRRGHHRAADSALVLAVGTPARRRSLFSLRRKQPRQCRRPACVSVPDRTTGRDPRPGVRLEPWLRDSGLLSRRVRCQRMERFGQNQATVSGHSSAHLAPARKLARVQCCPVGPAARRDRPHQHRHRLGTPAVGGSAHAVSPEFRQRLRAPPSHPVPAGDPRNGVRTGPPGSPVSLAGAGEPVPSVAPRWPSSSLRRPVTEPWRIAARRRNS